MTIDDATLWPATEHFRARASDIEVPQPPRPRPAPRYPPSTMVAPVAGPAEGVGYTGRPRPARGAGYDTVPSGHDVAPAVPGQVGHLGHAALAYVSTNAPRPVALRRAAPTGRHARRPVPRHRAVRRPKPGRPALSQPTGPHVRLGILWAGVTLGALLMGTTWLAGWLAVVAAMAAGTAIRSWGTPAVAQRLPHNRRGRVQPPAAVAAAFAALITLAGLAGGLVVAVAAAAVAVFVVAAATFGPLGQPAVLRRVVIILGPGVAAASLVLARAQGLAIGLVLAGMVTVFDSSAYLIGTGAPNHWEGSVAGGASVAALTLFVAAVLTPPFTGPSPWVLGAAAGLLAPFGPVLARWVTGDKAAPVPALRRLDSLFLAGPAWVAGVALLVHR